VSPRGYETAEPHGEFDAWTDVDVFIMRANAEPGSSLSAR